MIIPPPTRRLAPLQSRLCRRWARKLRGFQRLFLNSKFSSFYRALLFVCLVAFAILVYPKASSSHFLPSVDIVIVTRDDLRVSKTCLEGLRKRTSWLRNSLIIVDAGSTFSDMQWYEGFCGFHFCTFHEAGDIDYSTAVNIGVRLSRANFVVVMEPDVMVSYSWLPELYKALSRCPSHALVGPLSTLCPEVREAR